MIEAQAFKDTLSHWASGVTVVTAQLDDQRVGITASSFSSVSISPPQILICVVKKLYTHQIIEQSGCFAVHILQKEQLEWGMRFAGMIPELDDRFSGLRVETAVTGAPILVDSLAWLDCKVSAAYDGSDHTIFVGEVMATASGDLGEPLLYYHRNWRKLSDERLSG
ncbi:MAG: flavin reductase family protein [Caldilineaceae bacterium]